MKGTRRAALKLAATSCAVLLTFGCGGDRAPAAVPAADADASLSPPAFSDTPPAAQRALLTLDRFDVPPGGEVYKCQNFENPFGKDVALLQTQSRMSAGSHHLAVFRYDQNVNGELEDCSGLEFHTTIHAAQTPSALTKFPDGIGAFLPASDGIRLNAHYVNLGEKTVHAEVDIALDYVGADEVTYKAAQIYMNDGTLDVPPGPGTAGGTLAIAAEVGAVHLLSAQSHMHRHSVHELATLTADGSTLYESETWNEPPVKTYDPPLELAAGAEITWKCDIENDTSEHLTFGESAATNEMCVFTGFYYPAPDGKTIVGDVAVGNTFLTK